MARYLTQRAIAFIPTVLGISLLVFLAIRLIPGDAITAMLGTEAGMLTANQRAALEEYFGLDKPVYEQYLSWLGNLLQGDMGYSVRHGQPVLDVILARFPVTLELAVLAVLIALAIGLTFGVLSAIFHNSLIDLIGQLFALIGLAAPNFLIGTLIIYVLSVYFGILPNAGNYVEITEDPARNLQQLIFPRSRLGSRSPRPSCA